MLLFLFFSSFFALAQSNDLASKVSEVRDQYGLPGLAATHTKGNKILETSASGVRKFSDETSLTTEDKFHLGSCTKAMTATIVAMFIEEKKLQWDSPLKSLLPDISLHSDFSDVTLEKIMAHQAGLASNATEISQDLWKPGLNPVDGRALVAQTYLTRRSEVVPGSKFIYSNIGYMILGHILEKISGKSWEQLIQEKLFSPLGMKTCGFGVPSSPDKVDQPWGHTRNGGSFTPNRSDNPPSFGPAGTVHCSMTDWSKFLNLHMEGYNGKNNVLKATTYAKLHTIYPQAGNSYTYGGWNRYEASWAGGAVFNHTGSNTVNFARVMLLPKKQVLLLSTSNLGDESAEKASKDVLDYLIERHYK
jgi:D-alanyl-D-alanine carboxypeptidase